MLPFRTIQTQNKDVMAVQSNVGEVFRSLAVSPFSDGVFLEGVALTSAGVTINHGLQRQPRGWIVVDTDDHATYFRGSWDDRTIILAASVPVTVSLWVF